MIPPGPYKSWDQFHLLVSQISCLVHMCPRQYCMRVIAHPSGSLLKMVVLRLRPAMHTGHAHGVAETLQHTL